MKKQLFRQGDLLFIRVESMPEEGFEISDSGILLEGETTGHAHRVAEATVHLPKVDWDGVLEGIQQDMLLGFVEVGAAGADVTHEEHDPIHLEPGVYQAIRQREYTGRDVMGREQSRLVID